MTTIKRFTPDYKMHAVRFEAFAREAEHGEYVRFDAHQQKVSALEAERDALAVENAALKSASEIIRHLNANREEANFCGIDDCYIDDAVEAMITPATDAALAAIQAQGVERFADFLGKLYQCEKANTAKGKAYKHVIFLACQFVNEMREAK